MKERKTINFLGVHIDVLNTQGLLEKVINFTLEGKQRKVMYVNVDCILMSLKDICYRQILNRADLVYADGAGVVWGARLWGHRIPGRSTAADFMPDFCKDFAQNKLKIYLLGAKDGVAEGAAANLLKKIPDLKITGTYHGYFKREDIGRVIEEINARKPHILLVGFGAPRQEKWIEENAANLDVPVIWGVGGLFDFISERTWRGPHWLLDNGFEWLCRLIAEPRRLWRRYLIGNTKFILCLLWRWIFAREAL